MARRKQRGRKRETPRVGFLTKLVIFLLLIGVGVGLYNARKQVNEAHAESKFYAEQIKKLKQENEALSASISEGATEEKMEEIARNELGLVLPNEYVFYNISH